jgi:hypothetical protein
MKHFTENELLTCWQAVKNRKTKAEVAYLFSITEEEAVEMYSQAHKIYGRKPSTSGIALSDTTSASGGQEKPAQKWTRPKAVYDNPSHEDVLRKYGA